MGAVVTLNYITASTGSKTTAEGAVYDKLPFGTQFFSEGLLSIHLVRPPVPPRPIEPKQVHLRFWRCAIQRQYYTCSPPNPVTMLPAACQVLETSLCRQSQETNARDTDKKLVTNRCACTYAHVGSTYA